MGERSCPRSHNLMSKNHRSWRLVGRRRFHQTRGNPSAPQRSKRLDAICLFLASCKGGMEKGLGEDRGVQH